MNIAADVAAAMDDLGLGDEFSYDDLLAAMQSRQERPLTIVDCAELPPREGINALWLPTERVDVVLCVPTDSALHRQQFVLHELAHMLLNHGDDLLVDPCDALFPDIPPATLRRLLRRQHLDTEPEILAEALADRLAAAIRGSAAHESRFSEIFG